MLKRIRQVDGGAGGVGGAGVPAGPPARRPALVVEFTRQFFPVARANDDGDADRVRRLFAALLAAHLKKGGK